MNSRNYNRVHNNKGKPRKNKNFAGRTFRRGRFVNKRINTINLLHYKFLKNKNMRILHLRRFLTNKQIEADSKLDKKELLKKMVQSLDDKKSFDIDDFKFIPQAKIKFQVLNDEGGMTIEKMLNNYLILLNVPKELQLIVAVALVFNGYEPMVLKQEQVKQLVDNINKANIYGNLLIAANFKEKIDIILDDIYKKIIGVMNETDYMEKLNKLNNLLIIKNGRTFKMTWEQEVKRIKKLIDDKVKEPFINTTMKGENYFIKDNFWRFKNVLNGYSVGELMAVVYMINCNVEVWVTNIYAGPGKFLIEKLDCLEMFEQYFDVKNSTCSKLMFLDVASLAVPNIVL